MSATLTLSPLDIRGQIVAPIGVEFLRPAAWNARKTFNEKSLAELQATIEENGIQTPLIVRHFPMGSWHAPEDIQLIEDGCLYEVVTGHRRLEAAKRLGLVILPCFVREMSDEEARKIGLLDNVQREDVPALEEADAYEELRQDLGTAAAIAAQVGKDVAYVTKRLQLVALDDRPRMALAERLITIDHALLLARLGPEEQDENLKWALNVNAGKKESCESVIEQRIKERDRDGRYGYWEPQSVLSLKNHIEQHVGRKLSRAPWDLDDAQLVPMAGACSACPANTQANSDLFGDLKIDEGTCEDGACFESKRLALVNIRCAETFGANFQPAAKPGIALRLSWKISESEPRIDSGTGKVSLGQVLRYGQWIDTKPKSCPHVRDGVTVDWSDSGDRGYVGGRGTLRKPAEVLKVCIEPGCKVHPKAWEKKAANSSAASNSRSDEAFEAQRVAVLGETRLRVRLAGAAIEAVTKIPAEALRAVLIEAHPNGEEYEAALPGYKKILETAPVDSVQFAQAVALCSLEDLDVWDGYPVNHGRKDFIATLKRIGYDASKFWDQPKPAKKASAPAAKKSAAKKSAPKKKPAKKAAKKRGAK
jgi:ParB/RepB/Spo0J family partition protein